MGVLSLKWHAFLSLSRFLPEIYLCMYDDIAIMYIMMAMANKLTLNNCRKKLFCIIHHMTKIQFKD